MVNPKTFLSSGKLGAEKDTFQRLVFDFLNKLLNRNIGVLVDLTKKNQ